VGDEKKILKEALSLRKDISEEDVARGRGGKGDVEKPQLATVFRGSGEKEL